MTAADSARRRAVAGAFLIGLGFVLWALYRVAAGTESHAYTPGAQPEAVTLQQGHTYWLAVPGGVAHLRLEASGGLQCRAASTTGSDAKLALTAEESGTKATNDVASFVAPLSARVRVTCTGVFDAYVDNASGDPSGWALLAATAMLTVGAPLLLSAVRSQRLAMVDTREG